MFASQARGEQPGKVPCSLPARTKIKALAAGGALPAQWQWTVGKDIMAYFLGNLLPNPKKEEKKKRMGGRRELWFWKLWLADSLFLSPYNLPNCRHGFNYRWAGGARPRTGLQLEFVAMEWLGSELPAPPCVLAVLLAPLPGLAAPSLSVPQTLNEQQDSMSRPNPSS